MKQLLQNLGKAILVLLVAYAIGNVTGLFSSYHIPTPSMEPNVKYGEYVFTTNATGYQRGDVVSFIFPRSDKKEYYLKRLCGVEGDVIEMKQGVLFVNGENFDEQLELNHSYLVTTEQYKELKKNREISELEANEWDRYIENSNLDYAMVNIKDEIAKDLGLEKRPFESGDFDVNVVGNGDKDNFGPITIPKGQLLMLGDNRDNSLDSRFWGFCPVENWKGRLIFQF